MQNQRNYGLKIITFFLIMFISVLLTTTYIHADDNSTGTNATNEEGGFGISEGDNIEININAGNASGNAVEDLDEFLNGTDGLMVLVTSAGSVLIAFGLGQIFLAFKDDNPDAKAKGTMIFLGGVLLASLPGIMNTINSLT